MHYLKVKVGRPVRIFFPEEIHNTNISRKCKAKKQKALCFSLFHRNKKGFPLTGKPLIINLIIDYFFLNSTRRFKIRPASVELSAIGWVSPKAFTFNFLASTPELTK